MLLPAALALAMNCAQAADVDVAAGASATVGVRWTETVFVDITGDARDWRGVHWEPMASIGFLASRNDRQDDLDHDVFVAGAGIRLVGWWRGAFIGFEGGWADQTTDALSSHAQFISTLGWQGDRFVLMLRHISNGNLFGGRNLGETMLLAGLRF
jgi:hypothetical protein